MTTIVTADYGGFDRLWPQVPQTIDVEWVAFTDDPTLEAPAPWRLVVEEPRYDDPRMAAKWAKTQPHRAVDDGDVIWIDASMQVMSPTFAVDALAARRDGLAAFRHPRRTCIYAEADASLGAESQDGKYDGQPIREQVAYYRAEGHPPRWGLWACGTVAYDTTRLRVRAFGDAWLAECEQWSVQDQLSFPVVARRLDLRPGMFPVRQLERHVPWFGNSWLAIHEHQR